jgi:glycosyltransferase involved in cell wall biosynthesis
VRFLGTQHSVAEIAGLADVFLLPSELESFGLSALEAMACGVPVVGSDAGGMPELVAEGQSGYLRPVGDVEGMAACVLSILKHDALRQTLGAASRKRAEDLFSMERIVALYERHYERVLGR